eukprot:gene48536-59439_t
MAGSLWVVAPDPGRLASGLPRLLGWPAQKIADRVQELLQLLQLDPALF